ncbi:MAG: Asp-tRNA(Asn)/Glu-tRNA(Gln) amidotransferase GatCAB subunit [Betaproteobacteria bacterium]|nr:Asp-tRNA(Asn)/Glu-tRNA(Gln) amidotransferase GatCAB subunit [Betaproteobacteria bacterium]
MNLNDLHWLTAAEISAAYAARKLSPVELVKALLARIEKLEPQLHAFIKLDAEGVLTAAREAEREIRAGNCRGPLHGVPVGIKDIIDIAGDVTTCHSKIFLKNVAKADAEVISRLRGAGAIPFGKLSLHEFAIGGPSFDLPFPPARNPWNVNHHPGGSSSGSGTALAAGLLPVALGTDTGGSIRNPAGTCGVVGLKPTYGLVSRRGVFPLAFTLDHIGPMARSVEDAALSLDVLAGHDARDPGSNAVSSRGYGVDLERGARGLRVGFVRHFHEKDIPAHPEVTVALDAAAKVLKREGASVIDVKLPSLLDLGGVQRIFMLAESWTVHAQWLRERPGDYAEMTRRKLMGGAFLSAGDYVHAQQRRLQLTDAVNHVFRDVDILLCANSLDPACRIDDEAEVARTYPRQARAPFNLTGHPALAMMCGLSKAGLPIAVQFVGRMHDEATVLRAAAAYERATDWHTMRAPVEKQAAAGKRR